jgi:protein required for attachment to host cells
MRLENGTWVLVLDATKALVFENTTDGFDPNLRVVRKEENDEDTAGARARGVDRNEPAPTPKDSDAHRPDEHRFVEDVADQLYKAAHRGRFDRLVVVAGPQHLGTLRQSLHKEVSSRIVAEVQKTLTGHPVDQIERILSQELANA